MFHVLEELTGADFFIGPCGFSPTGTFRTGGGFLPKGEFGSIAGFINPIGEFIPPDGFCPEGSSPPCP
jgi:hypothetical protein